MTATEHVKRAEELLKQADAWMDTKKVRSGWPVMTTEERIQRRTADLMAAQVHANLALISAITGRP